MTIDCVLTKAFEEYPVCHSLNCCRLTVVYHLLLEQLVPPLPPENKKKLIQPTVDILMVFLILKLLTL